MPVLMRFEKDYLEKHAPGKHNQQNHAGGRSSGKVYENLGEYMYEVVPKENVKAWEEKLMAQTYSQDTDPAEELTLKNYIGADGLVVNRLLRQNAELDNEQKSMVEGISRAMKSTTNIKEPITVYRGIKPRDDANEVFGKLEVGDTFQDSGFISTSLNPYIAGQMAFLGLRPQDQGILMKITVPAGSEGVYPNSFLKGLNEFGQEVEFLLPTNTKLKVNNKLGRVWEMEVVNG